jgi:hypothetical protein
MHGPRQFKFKTMLFIAHETTQGHAERHTRWLTLVRGISSEMISSSSVTSTRHHTSAIAAPCPSIAIMSWKNVGHCCG